MIINHSNNENTNMNINHISYNRIARCKRVLRWMSWGMGAQFVGGWVGADKGVGGFFNIRRESSRKRGFILRGALTPDPTIWVRPSPRQRSKVTRKAAKLQRKRIKRNAKHFQLFLDHFKLQLHHFCIPYNYFFCSHKAILAASKIILMMQLRWKENSFVKTCYCLKICFGVSIATSKSLLGSLFSL